MYLLIQMTSVERILQYTTLAQETEHEVKGTLHNDWPEHGKIEMQDVTLRYSETSPQALCNVSLILEPKEKVCCKTRILSVSLKPLMQNISGFHLVLSRILGIIITKYVHSNHIVSKRIFHAIASIHFFVSSPLNMAI